MKDSDILSLIGSELSNADENLDFATPLDYYLGNPNGKEIEGRSQVTSTDVADVIEWIMPQIMKSFTQNNEIVIFDPVHPGDEFQAEMESQYVYDVLMKENTGFITLHQFVKDALMQNNGFIKTFYSDDEEVITREFTGLVPEQLKATLASPEAELVSSEERKVTNPMSGEVSVVVDARISITKKNKKIEVESVAPEDFRINTDHNSINIDKANFTAHLMTKTISELREEGVSKDKIDKLSTGDAEDKSDYRFYAQGEQSMHDDESEDDKSMKEIQLAECYLYIDANEDGIAEYMKITVAGQETPYLIIDQEEIDCSPWVATTAILMSHKWRGLSFYDRIKEIQDQKTALARNTLDNIYYQNNQRHAVVENQVNMDDMTVSRPGGVVRVKRLDAIVPLVNPPVSQDAFTMLNYLDQIRTGRSGVSPESEAKPQNIGERVGSQGLERLMNAKEELVGLVVRVIAETGIKPLCFKIRDLCTQHVDAIKDYKFRGQWIKVNPAIWYPRDRYTVRVGTGSGNHQAQVAALGQVMAIQDKLQQQPGQTLIDPVKIFKALDDFCKFSGLNTAVNYFLDPESPEGQQKAQQVGQQMQQQQEQQQQVMMEQLNVQKQLAQAETEKANIARMNTELKGQTERARASLQHEKQRSDLTIQQLNHRIQQFGDIVRSSSEDKRIQLEYDKMYSNVAMDLTKLEAEKQKEENANFEQNRETVEK